MLESKQPINIGKPDCPTEDDLRHLVLAQNKLLAKMEESNKTLLLKMDRQLQKTAEHIEVVKNNTLAIIELTKLLRSAEYADQIAGAISKII